MSRQSSHHDKLAMPDLTNSGTSPVYSIDSSPAAEKTHKVREHRGYDGRAS